MIEARAVTWLTVTLLTASKFNVTNHTLIYKTLLTLIVGISRVFMVQGEVLLIKHLPVVALLHPNLLTISWLA